MRPSPVPLGRERGLSQTGLAFAGLLLLAFAVRVLFIGAAGFPNDVSAFESWALTLADHPTSEFYAKAGFADYPPGYFYVLWVCGHLYRLLVHSDPTYSALKFTIKLPGILCDVVDTALVFAIVRRYASTAWSFGAAALFAFNPALIYISAYWGQVDSVPGALTLASLYLLLGADARAGRARDAAVIGAWLLLAASVLMKPPAIVLAPIYLAWVLMTDARAERVRRAFATLAGVALAFVLAYLSTLPFHPGLSPVAQFAWLYGRYQFAANVYAYNSVNAFNLYVMAPNNHFWMSDATPLPNWTFFGHTFGFPMYGWGIGLFVAAVALVISRLVQRRDSIALLEAAMVLSLGYFVLSTRMHERYIFNALLLAIPLAFYQRRYLYAAFAITLTLFANLTYSFDYIAVMGTPTPGVDATDLMPFVSRPGAFVNVATFFYLGYVFLGSGADVLESWGRKGVAVASDVAASTYHRWFSPLEGTARMLPRDWAIAAFLTVTSFVVSYVDYTWPAEKIFDEIYYARAGEEYLQHKEIFEFTHPPLTKLWVTLSMMLFGGMHGLGDTSAGWRFLNLVMGALMVLVIYCFAKRLLGSTAFATVAGSLLLLDGFHYVQSRIATPEITVAFFALLTLYAFYRFWIASQVRVAPLFERSALGIHAAFFAGGLVLAAAFSWFVAGGGDATAHVVAFLYVASGAYVAVRLLVPRFVTKPVAITSYADGSYVLRGTLVTPDGGALPAAGPVVPGDTTVAGKNELVAKDEGLRIEYGRSGIVRYKTDAGDAAFYPDGTMRAGDARIDGRRDGAIWLAALSVSAGCLAASKWNGLFDFFVIFGLVGAVAAQRWLAPLRRALGLPNVIARAATLGNPLGFSVDVVVAALLFVGATIYTLCYIPYFSLGHNFGDLVGLQSQMFGYHYDLKATHPYGSKWWQWPFILRPISYFYHDWRTGAALQSDTACCVAEIIAIPNPAVWWGGLISVPFIGWLAFRERNKGYALLVLAYLLQWLPWMTSPRVAFEYHFFPNLAIICLANAVLLQRAWRYGVARAVAKGRRWTWPKVVVGGYLALVLYLFVFFYPVLAGLHVPWNVWDARMWHWLMRNQWV